MPRTKKKTGSKAKKKGSRGKTKFPLPPPERRCQAALKTGPHAGEQCPKWAQRGKNVCGAHDGKQAQKWGRKGGEATSARWSEVKAAAQRLPLQSPQNQQLYVIDLIDREDRRQELERKPPRLSMLINLLFLLDAITKKVPLSGQKFDVTYQAKLPEPDPEQYGQVPDLPPVPGPETEEQAEDSLEDYVNEEEICGDG